MIRLLQKILKSDNPLSRFDRRPWMVPIQQIRMLSRIRFFVLAGILLVFVISLTRLGWTPQLRLAAELIAAALVVHSVFEGVYALAERGRFPLSWAIRLSHFQILVDLVMILMAIHLTGGPYSPLDVLLSAFLVGVAMAYSRRFALATLIVTLVAHLGLMLSYALGWLPVYRMNALFDQAQPDLLRILYLNSIDWIVFCAVTVITLLLTERLQQAYQETAWERGLLAHLRQLVHRSLNQEHLGEMVRGLVQDLAALSGIPRVYLVVWDESRDTPVAMAAYEGGRVSVTPQEINGRELQRLARECDRCTPHTARPLTPQDLPLSVVSHAWPFPSGSDVRFYPLRTARKGTYLGLAVFLSPEPNPLFRQPLWQSHMRDVMDVVGLILARAVSETQLEDDRALLEHLGRLSAELASALDREQLARLAVEGGREMLGAERGALYVLDPKRQRLDIWHAHGLSDQYLNYVKRSFLSLPGIRVISSQEPYIISDTEQMALQEPAFVQAIRREGFRSYAVLPLSTFQGPIGGLILYWDKPRTFRKEELVVLRLWASHVASALSNTLLIEHLREEAETDPMTHTLNRRPLAQRMVEALQQAEREGSKIVVFMMDVDDFKRINDTYGHAVGDAVLRRVASVLTEAAQSVGGFVARYGGDEFVLVLPGLDREEAQAVMARVQNILYNEPASDLPPGLRIRLSSGYAVYPDDGKTPDELLKVADERLYQVKWQRKGRPPDGKGRPAARGGKPSSSSGDAREPASSASGGQKRGPGAAGAGRKPASRDIPRSRGFRNPGPSS
ncbi:MAG: sensor domain-containing diguanylate cyclase [Chloroflexi bacterium]|nr:sensor domain-containing diguanylate cyclase [Chloroflexota bacterium]